MESYSQRTNLMRARETFTIEDGELVRRMGEDGETRWPLADLTRAVLVSHRIGPHARRLMLQLAFARRRGVVLTSHSVEGFGRLIDETGRFRAFGRRLLDQARSVAPAARLVRAGAVTGSTLWWAVAALGCGAVVVAASAMASGASTLGLDLGARLAFLALLAACALPWMNRGMTEAIGPQALLDQ